MIIRQQQAAACWCPLARTVTTADGAGLADYSRKIATGNRIALGDETDDANPEWSACIGSGCMAWRWHAIENDEGFCGAFGRPS
jgi:hypothetical protein